MKKQKTRLKKTKDLQEVASVLEASAKLKPTSTVDTTVKSKQSVFTQQKRSRVRWVPNGLKEFR